MPKPKPKNKIKPEAATSTHLRPIVRETLAESPRKLTLEALHGIIRKGDPGVSLKDVRDALLWNQSKGFVDYIHNRDFETDEWFLIQKK